MWWLLNFFFFFFLPSRVLPENSSIQKFAMNLKESVEQMIGFQKPKN